jgi:hypothetical protein
MAVGIRWQRQTERAGAEPHLLERRQQAMVKWEYQVETCERDDLEEKLTELGEY